jgi:hypothetical protein
VWGLGCYFRKIAFVIVAPGFGDLSWELPAEGNHFFVAEFLGKNLSGGPAQAITFRVYERRYSPRNGASLILSSESFEAGAIRVLTRRDLSLQTTRLREAFKQVFRR